jgi:hypothetical protein
VDIAWTKRRQRKKEVAARAATPDATSPYCHIVGCKNPTRAGAGTGLNRRYCRVHEDSYQRHGSPHRGSYDAASLNPYRRATFDWLTANADNIWVKNAIVGVQRLYRVAGPAVEAFRLRGMKPRERAWAAWARLRRAEIDPRLPLAAWIAVELILCDDPPFAVITEFRRVQAAKVIHRIVSGTHRRWEQERLQGRPIVTEMHKFPLSRGHVLRYIGKDIERVAEFIVEKHLDDIAAFKAQQEKDGKLGKRAHPGHIKGVAKRAKRTKPQLPATVPSRSMPSLPPSDQPADPNELRRDVQDQIRKTLEGMAASPELSGKTKGPFKVALPDGTVVERK